MSSVFGRDPAVSVVVELAVAAVLCFYSECSIILALHVSLLMLSCVFCRNLYPLSDK